MGPVAILPAVTQFFLSRCKFSTLTLRQLMVEFYLLTFSLSPLLQILAKRIDDIYIYIHVDHSG